VLHEYSEYVSGVVRRLFGSASELHAQWRTQAGRDRVVEELESRGVELRELAERSDALDLDAFDLLVHVAWNRPAVNRRQRADRVRREQADFFESFAGEAREILLALLDKYAEHGIEELDDLKVLETAPFSELGTPVEIATRFGGAAALREAVAGMQALVYS
jgi:type I restriction enzyme R subunit